MSEQQRLWAWWSDKMELHLNKEGRASTACRNMAGETISATEITRTPEHTMEWDDVKPLGEVRRLGSRCIDE